MSNRLAQESSPYLLQHQHNPVDWQPWDEQALRQAKEEKKPIFLSIGYSACHWCHVMERESFENEEIAAQLNENFVCIKVDREERPDLDQIYMNAILMLSGGRGGWPMSVFLTPDGKPFYGGTYWPPQAKMGMPGFDQVLAGVARVWSEQQNDALVQADEVTSRLTDMTGQSVQQATEASSDFITPQLLVTAQAALERAFDFTHGGFGRAPKFPHSMDLQLLLRVWRRRPRDGVLQMVRLNLDKMARGGIYDHLGGGFARYSVDERWLVPHFEKMLYDNALLAATYLQAFQAAKSEDYARTARETLDWVLREMTDPEGGFHSTLDADSEGEEGKFYVWTPEEVQQVLGEERAERFCYVYDVTEEGNFEGKNILNLAKTIEQSASLKGWNVEELQTELAQCRAEMLSVRNERVWPGKDDKVLVSWNSLMIEALAQGAGVLDEPRYLQAAQRAAEFLLSQLRRPDGRLLHSWREGLAKFDGYLDDYSYLINALISLYEAGFEERWIEEAVALADVMMARFADQEHGGFFFTADDHEQLIARNKDYQDSSVPSGNSMAATALVRLGALTGRTDYLEAARATVESAAAWLQKAPTAFGQMLIAADWLIGPVREVVVVGEAGDQNVQDAFADYRRRFLPRCVVACRREPETGGEVLNPLFAGKQTSEPSPTVYVCEGFSCQSPVSGLAAARKAWDDLETLQRT